MLVFAIDPGPTESAYVLYDPSTRRLKKFGKVPNEALLSEIDDTPDREMSGGAPAIACVIERIESYGMAVGREVFETCFWIGRFDMRWCMATYDSSCAVLLPRRDVKLNLCGQARAKDGNIRQALIDRHGGKAAVGKKSSPGPLYGVSGDVWSALAVAVTWADKNDDEAIPF